jgi:hypothetical protein
MNKPESEFIIVRALVGLADGLTPTGLPAKNMNRDAV